MNNFKSVLLKALRKSGHLIKKSISGAKTVDFKNEINLVTQIDKKSESLIVSMIKKAFPDHSILAEESSPEGESPLKWIIDPLDGTTNFVHSFPVCVPSIALEKNGEVVLGGVYDPFRDELFFAEKGKGAYLNKKPISVSTVSSLKDSMLGTGFPYDRRKNADYYLEIYKRFMIKAHGIRRVGAAALDLCYLACGRYDGFWELKLSPWDVAAGSLIIEEAGGKITDFSGNPYDIYGIETAASNSSLHSEILDTLTDFRTK